MAIELDRARESYQSGLKKKAKAKKRDHAAIERDMKPNMKRPGEFSVGEGQARMMEQLEKILEHLDQHKHEGSMPVSFTVTERDGNGKIKSFKVSRG